MGIFSSKPEGSKARAEFVGELAKRFDSWQNFLTGLGTSRDKRTSARPMEDALLDPDTLDTLYHNDDFAAKICDAPVEDALKKGFDLTSDAGNSSQAKDEIGRTREYLEELEALDELSNAGTWSRVHGDGIILLGVEGAGAPWEPLDDDRVKRLAFLSTFDRRDLQPSKYYSDPFMPKFGRPEIFRVQPTTPGSVATSTPKMIHETRLIIIRGTRTSKRKRAQNSGWSHSTLQKVYEVLRDTNTAFGSVSHLVTDASMGVFKLKGFLEAIAGKDVEDLRTRMEMLDMSRSVSRSWICDADSEDFERKATSFGGLPEVIDRHWQRLAAAANMPVTRLIGISAAGLNSTGKGEQDNWDDYVAAFQQQKLLAPATRIARLAAKSVGVTSTISVCFPPLRQLGPLDQATRRKTIADTDAVNISNGIYLPEEITIARSKGGGFGDAEPVADLKVRERALKAELVKLEEDAGKPDPAPLIEGPSSTPATETEEADPEAA
jgi:phage-related protein (TIGR01555 family)